MLKIENVSNVIKSLREMANVQYLNGGHDLKGYKKCLCKTKCDTNTCKC